jgi:hypothetical protein
MDAWLQHLAKTVRSPDRDCFFIGHSLGCITILRYIEKLKENQEVGGAVLVAGFTDDLGYGELKTFFLQLPDWERIKARCTKFTAIHSDNDPYVPLKYGDVFKEKLGAEVIVEHGMRHFSGDDGITELPAVLDAVLKMAE